MNWQKYEVSDEHIPMSEWGHDHWSTIAYLETICVDNHGMIENPKMRCNPYIHSMFGEIEPSPRQIQYPTRLKNREVSNHALRASYAHDDWSCLEDMIQEGLLDAEIHEKYTGYNEVRIKLTPMGIRIAHQLRAHRLNGGKYYNFEVGA